MKAKLNLKFIINKYIEIPIEMKASLAFILASLLTQGLSIITMPIFTRVMEPSDIGIVTIYNSWEVILGIFAGLALSSGSFNIAMMEFKNNRDEYISSILTISTFSALVMYILYFIFSDTIHNWINLPKELFHLMFIGFVIMPATNFWILKQRYEYEYKKVTSLTTIIAILSATLGVAFVLYFKKSSIDIYSLGTVRLFATKLIPYIVGIIIYLSFMLKSKIILSWQYVTFALKLSLPLLIHALAKQVLDISDRIMIEEFEGLSAVGIYGILYTLSSLSLIIWNAINASLIPFLFRELEKSEVRSNRINAVIKPLITFYFVFCIFLMLVAPEVVNLLATEKYYNAVYLMPPIAAGIFFTSFYNMFSNVLLFYKKTYLIMGATIGAAVINVVLNFIFIQKYGYIAAAYTTLFAYLVLAILQFEFMKRITNGVEIFESRYLWALAILMILLSFLVNILYNLTLIRYVVIISILIVVFIKRNYILAKLLEQIKRS